MQFRSSFQKKGILIVLITLLLAAVAVAGGLIGSRAAGGKAVGALAACLVVIVPLLAYLIHRTMVLPYYRRLEDANLELHLRQEELLDLKDDLFIKFLGISDANYAANSPRLFERRLRDVADVTGRVMEADLCLIYLYDKKRDELALAASNEEQQAAVGRVRLPLGEGIEGWVGRRLEPVMLKDLHADARFKQFPGLAVAGYRSVYCLPLYVYSSGALMGVMELFSEKARTFSDEEITFFTTLAGILSTTVQNEQLQSELRKMNLELEQWVAEKTEELRASEERFRTLVENASESILVLADNGDVLFANEQAARLTGIGKYDLLHKNFFELFVDPAQPQGLVSEVSQGREALRHGELRRANGTVVPVELSAVGLVLMGKRFLQAVVRDLSAQRRLEKLIEEKDREIATLRDAHGA